MIKGESFSQLIESFCHLVNNMKRLNIQKQDYEYIDKLADALPSEWETYIMIQQSNPIQYARLTLASFIEKLEAQELDIRKKQKMKLFTVGQSQDVGLYYRGQVSGNPKIQPRLVLIHKLRMFKLQQIKVIQLLLLVEVLAMCQLQRQHLPSQQIPMFYNVILL